MARWMALDVGSKTIGVAVTDPLRVTVRPLTTLRRQTMAEDVARITQLVDEQQVERLLVGLPRHLGGEPSATLEFIEPLHESLLESVSVPVEWAEERLSTKQAEELMSEAGLKLPERKRRRNEFAAAVILQWYLQDAS